MVTKKEKKQKASCNQCGRQMKPIIYAENAVWGVRLVPDGAWIFSYCTHPACPNYGIVQTPAEEMPEEGVK